jgi:16S rRNA (cytidine1402-2'-O)-methyltransferase
VPALVKSGLPNDRFIFEGFLPHKKGRQTRLQNLVDETRTMVFYESPHRLVKMLNQLAEVLGKDRQASVSRELTKIYEETVNGTLEEVAQHFEGKKVKGEIVVVVAGA